MEYRVFSTDGALLAIIDFADLDNKIAYRFQSVNSYHDSYSEDLKATNQRTRLKARGWIVEDINEDTHEWFWLWL
jgi:hypothetical protein